MSMLEECTFKTHTHQWGGVDQMSKIEVFIETVRQVKKVADEDPV